MEDALFIQKIKAILQNDGLSFEIETNGEVVTIQSFIPIAGKITSCAITAEIDFAHNFVISTARVPIKITKSLNNLVMEYISRANYALRVGYFQIDNKAKEVIYIIKQEFYSDASEEFYDHLARVLFFMPPGMIRRYGEGLLHLVYNKKNISPEQAIFLAEKNK